MYQLPLFAFTSSRRLMELSRRVKSGEAKSPFIRSKSLAHGGYEIQYLSSVHVWARYRKYGNLSYLVLKTVDARNGT
jgi:hypothetical protein